MSQEELEKCLSELEEKNRDLMIELDAHNKKSKNISAFLLETRRVMNEEINRLGTERDKVMNELKELKEENDRYKNELKEHDRRSRERPELEIVSDSDVEDAERNTLQLLEEIRDIEHEIEILISNIAKYTTAAQMTEKISEEYERELEHQRKELTAIMEESAEREAEIQQFENKIKIMEADLERKITEVKKKEQENSSLEESIQKDKIQVEALKAIIDEHQRKEQQIDNDFEMARLEFQMVMNEKQTEIDDVKKQIIDLQAQANSKILAKKKPSLLRRRVGRLFRHTTNRWNELIKKD